ncbi:MAG TPA: hypothetical protein VGO93_17970 [Candidatus Xenobia bacterium]
MAVAGAGATPIHWQTRSADLSTSHKLSPYDPDEGFTAKSKPGESDILFLDTDKHQLHEVNLQGSADSRSAAEQALLQGKLKDHPTWSVAVAADGGQASLKMGATHSIAQARGVNTEAIVKGHDATAMATNGTPHGSALAAAGDGGSASATNSAEAGHANAAGWNGTAANAMTVDVGGTQEDTIRNLPPHASWESMDGSKRPVALAMGQDRAHTTSVVVIHCDDGQAIKLTQQTPMGPMAQLDG